MIALVLLQISLTLGGNEVTEASGLVVSPTQRGIFWTHNDSGDGPYFYAFDQKGKPRATVLVRNAHAFDWEDMAVGPYRDKPGSWLYAADIGDNRVKRTDPCVYVIPEPKVGRSSREKPLLSADAICLRLKYPDGPHNAECLLCDPRDGRLTIVTKEPSGKSGVYRFPAVPNEREVNELEKVAVVSIPTGEGRSPLVTGGDYRPDGQAIAYVTYTHLYEFKGSPWWLATPVERPLPKLPQCEAVTYARDGKSIWLTSEGKKPPLIQVKASE